MDYSIILMGLLAIMVILVLLICFARQDDKDATMRYLREWEDEQERLKREGDTHEQEK